MQNKVKQGFIDELWSRFKLPWKQSAFKSYFVWIVVLFGGLGILITIYQEFNSSQPVQYETIAKAIATTFVALTAASLVDLNLSVAIQNIPSLIINSVACIGLSILLLYFSFSIDSSYALIPASVGYLISILIWILANADNDKLSDETYYTRMKAKADQLSANW